MKICHFDKKNPFNQIDDLFNMIDQKSLICSYLQLCHFILIANDLN